jgi:hypothetical protein
VAAVLAAFTFFVGAGQLAFGAAPPAPPSTGGLTGGAKASRSPMAAAPMRERSAGASSCSPAALAAYNYEVVRKYLEHPEPSTGPTAPESSASPHLLVSGRVQGDQWTLLPLQTVWTRAGASASATGTYRLALVSESGEVTEVRFQPSSARELPGVSVFTLLVPDPGPLARVELSDGKKQLWEKRASAVPDSSLRDEDVVQVEESDGALQLSWDAATFPFALVAHLSDGRRTTLGVGLEGGAASLPKGSLPEDGLFEVSLSDGVRTTARYFPRR